MVVRSRGGGGPPGAGPRQVIPDTLCAQAAAPSFPRREPLRRPRTSVGAVSGFELVPERVPRTSVGEPRPGRRATARDVRPPGYAERMMNPSSALESLSSADLLSATRESRAQIAGPGG